MPPYEIHKTDICSSIVLCSSKRLWETGAEHQPPRSGLIRKSGSRATTHCSRLESG